MEIGKRIKVQAHRGGLGYRTEESLYAFANAIELGVDTLEMDSVFTSDGVPVIWHDHSILGTKCRGDYVGRYIANLTLDQVKSMDCGLQLVDFQQARVIPGTQIATLAEVLDLVNCYEDRTVTINLETKLDPTQPNQTLSVDTYINDIWPIVQSHGLASRTTIQSFDWRTLIGIKRKFPTVNTIVLTDPVKVVPSSDGTYPWLGGINLDKDFGGDFIAAAASIHASAFSPLHGYAIDPVLGVQTGATQNTPGYLPFTTKDVVDRAHKFGLEVIPWTIDSEVLVEKLIDDGVDSIISDYPERVMWIARRKGYHVGRPTRPHHPECLAKASKPR
ncbi:glycerophosphoryl diester phosphodiesterase [Tothia fuscella]|uniref:Glycerophosphoryl diester phosphodiesterase n=1 Tax=Tothia fuscella TaxID=1048955 RepID=A0A9P4NKZ3_9PEZI|nr:glycerophosphoryl diester phosphodiesterase [Tothia fuscella]